MEFYEGAFIILIPALIISWFITKRSLFIRTVGDVIRIKIYKNRIARLISLTAFLVMITGLILVALGDRVAFPVVQLKMRGC